MVRNTRLHIARALAATALTITMSGVAVARGGGGGGFSGGGDNGDSSMNPFTGDSYAYFHGGHNLGEQGTIRPDRPNPRFSTAQSPKANAPATASSDQARAPQRQQRETTEPSGSR